MKVKKEQFLLPKAKAVGSNNGKWIQPMRNTCEYPKTLTCTTVSSQPIVGGLAAGLVQSDVVIKPVGDVIVSGNPLIWQQQDGILRQALMNNEQDLNCEMKVVNPMNKDCGQVETCVIPSVAPGPSLLAISTVGQQQITPIAAPQVIKMNDYQVILSNEGLPAAWPENRKEMHTQVVTPLPPIKSKVESGILFGNQQLTFTSLGSVDIIGNNQFPTIVINDRNSPLTNNVTTCNSVIQNSSTKKPPSKTVSKTFKVRKKPVQARKLMVKPPSSLLTQTALKDRIQSLVSTASPNTPVNVANPVSNYKIGINSQLSYVIDSVSAKDNFTGSNDYGQCITSEAIKESDNIECAAIPDQVLVYSEPSVEPLVQGGNELPSEQDKPFTSDPLGNHLGCKTTKINSDELKLNDNSMRVVSENIETIILPLDMENHEEHRTQEYSDNILSQLTEQGALPNMSSSQISSVLNDFGSSDKILLNLIRPAYKSTKEAVKCEPEEFVKIENVQLANSTRTKDKLPVPKYSICELNKSVCFRCECCMFISLKAEVLETHWSEVHCNPRKNELVKSQLRCLGCTNVFHSKYALQIHLLCDHKVIIGEIDDLISSTISANKNQRDLKKQTTVESTLGESTIETGLDPAETVSEVSVECALPDGESSVTELEIPESQIVLEADIILEEPSPTTDPSTPSFDLFSKILEHDVNEEPIPLETISSFTENDSKNTTYKKAAKCVRSYKSTRNKIREEFTQEVKYNYRCLVGNCKVHVSTTDNLVYHRRCHRVDSEMLFCPECDFSVYNWSSLILHLWREHKVDIDLYSCKHCNFKSNSYSKLINNHIRIHGDERPFLCDVCGKGFKTTKQLRNHKSIHRGRRKFMSRDTRSGDPENTDLDRSFSAITCNICSRSFTDSRFLKHHTEIVHNKARPYLCTFCSHAASSKSSLQMHIRQHTGEKPFSCEECAYVTSDHNSLRRHKMRHSGKRPYQCPHCSYECIQATTYKSHIINKHPGLDEGLMYSCPVCPFHTVKKDNYLTHKAEHDLGGDPRSRRKKSQPPVQIERHAVGSELDFSASLCKTVTDLPEEQDADVFNNTVVSTLQDKEIQEIIQEPTPTMSNFGQ